MKMDYLRQPGSGEPQLTDVVIPALNESETIGSVVEVFRATPGIGQVIVVNDMSSDRTGRIAEKAGASVVRGAGLGKGQAMQIGVSRVKTSRVIFADADLSGFRPNHAGVLAKLGHQGMIVGYRDKGRTGNFLAIGSQLPPISGERSVPVSLIRGLKLDRYYAEMQINAAVSRAGLPVVHFIMKGVSGKVKAGPLRVADVLPAMFDSALLKYHADWIPSV